MLYGYILRCMQCGLISYIESIKGELSDSSKIAIAVSRGKSLIKLCKQTENMLGGMIVWLNILRLVDVTCGIYLSAVIGSVFRGGEINFVALASFAANGSLIILGYYGIKPLFILGQVHGQAHVLE